jgi:iron complex transport system substrate-binding protein
MAAALIVLPVAGCREAPPPERSSQRIVSVIPAVTEMLFAIGAGPRVVGVGTFDRYPPEVDTRTRVGALIDPDFERILSLKPDLVIAYGTQTEFIGRLRRAGIDVFPYQHAGLADVTTTIRALGERLGLAAPADRVAGDVEAQIAAVRRSAAGRPRPRVALLFDREAGSLRTMFASGGVGFMHDMLVAAGGENAFGDVARQSLQVSTELLLARAPEVIIEIQTNEVWPADRIAREREAWSALTSVPAVRTGRIHLLTDQRLSVPGPRVGEAVQLLAQTLHAGR